MKAMKAVLWLIGSSVAGLFGLVLAGSTSWLRKGKALEAAKALNDEVEHAKSAEEFRAKVVAAVAEKAKVEAEQEKAHDTVDNANNLIASLVGGADEPSGG